MKNLKPHKFAELAPMMSDVERAALKADLAENGQREPIVEYQGQILDGRNRYGLLKELGVKPKIVGFGSICPNGGDAAALAFVKSKLMHRNLTDSQKAAVAVRYLPHFEKLAVSRMKSGGGGTSSTGSENGKARDQVGGLFGVSGRYVSDARMIFERDPKLFQQVFDGRLPVTRAKRLVIRKDRTRTARAVARSGRLVHPDDATILTGDTLEEMKKLPRKSFRLVFADPPYNLGFKYDADPTKDLLPRQEYLRLTERWIAEAIDLLTPDGTFCWMIPEEWVAFVGTILRERSMHIRRLIVWHESFGQAGQNNFGRTCRFIWYAVKDPQNFIFDGSAILVESKRASVYGDSRAMPGGKVPDALWDFSRVAGTFSERIPDEGIPTQLPVELVKRAVLCFTETGDSVLDPFGGTGTTARAALSCGRKCTLIERSKKYVAIAKRELALMSAKKED